MKPDLTILPLIIGFLLNFAGRLGAAEEKKDSAAGLPPAYAKNYLVARSTMSPDKKFAIIYPTIDFSESKEAKDFVVALKPFAVLAPLPTEDFYFERRSNGGISAKWSNDDSLALVTINRKGGRGVVFVIDFPGGAGKQIPNVPEKRP